MKLSKWGSAVIGFRVANFNVLEYSVVQSDWSFSGRSKCHSDLQVLGL